jgi:hypothetical protein
VRAPAGQRHNSRLAPPGGRGGGSPKRLCIYSVLSMCGRCPRREQSAHVGVSPPLSRSPGCGGGGGTPPKGLWPPAEPPTPCVPRAYDFALFSLLSTSRPRPGGGEACVRIRCWGPRGGGLSPPPRTGTFGLWVVTELQLASKPAPEIQIDPVASVSHKTRGLCALQDALLTICFFL